MPDKPLKYRCGNCGKSNQAIAKGLLSGDERTFCPNCKGREAGAVRRRLTMDQWRQAGVPEAFVKGLSHLDGSYWHTCQHGHRTQIHNAKQALLHLRDGRFRCPTCVEQQTGLSQVHAARLEVHQESLRRSVESLQLAISRFLPYRDKEAVAEVRCPAGHHFEVDRRSASLMSRNKCLADRSIVPNACPACCFPGVAVDEVALLRSTVFHRLYVLEGLYPNARYISGFDPVGRAVEQFSCGARHEDGTEHPPIRISFRGLSKESRRAPNQHLCVACGLKVGQVIGRGKTLDDLRSVMKVMRNELSAVLPPSCDWSEPTVDLVAGELSSQGEIHTTKTKLRFWCGVSGHEPMIATKDYYFNRAPARGAGFCPACVDLTGEAKAPLPGALHGDGALRPLMMRAAGRPERAQSAHARGAGC